MDLVTVLGAFLAHLGRSREVWCSKIPAKNKSKRTLKKPTVFAILALLGWLGKPSWLT